MSKFIYYNRNPYGENISDCVTRSISLATNIPYQVIAEKLNLTAELLDCDKLCMSCYQFLIEKVFCCEPVNCDDMTVGEFADKHPYGTYLIRMNGHISCIIDNYIYDTWDCRYEQPTNAWLVK